MFFIQTAFYFLITILLRIFSTFVRVYLLDLSNFKLLLEFEILVLLRVDYSLVLLNEVGPVFLFFLHFSCLGQILIRLNYFNDLLDVPSSKQIQNAA